MEILLGVTGMIGASIVLFGVSLNDKQRQRLNDWMLETWDYLDDANAYTISLVVLKWFRRKLTERFGNNAFNISAILFFLKWQFLFTLAVIVATLPSNIWTSLHGIDLEPLYRAEKDVQVLLTNPDTNNDYVQFVSRMIENVIEVSEMVNQTGSAWRFVIDGLTAFCIEASVFLVVSPAIAYVSIGVTRMLIEHAVSHGAMRTILGAITLDILAAIFLSSVIFWIYNVLAIVAFKGYLYAFPLVGYPIPEATLFAGIGYEMLLFGDWISASLSVADRPLQFLSVIGSITAKMWALYFSDVHAFLRFDWTIVTNAEAIRNWSLTLSLLPTAIYLSAILITSIGSRADFVRKAGAMCIAWGIERERGTLVALGGAIVGLCVAIRVAVF